MRNRSCNPAYLFPSWEPSPVKVLRQDLPFFFPLALACREATNRATQLQRRLLTVYAAPSYNAARRRRLLDAAPVRTVKRVVLPGVIAGEIVFNVEAINPIVQRRVIGEFVAIAEDVEPSEIVV